jgi:hypothetical protein
MTQGVCDMLYLTMTFPKNGKQDGILLALSTRRMRIALDGYPDVVELREVEGRWSLDDGTPVELDGLFTDGNTDAALIGELCPLWNSRSFLTGNFPPFTHHASGILPLPGVFEYNTRWSDSDANSSGRDGLPIDPKGCEMRGTAVEPRSGAPQPARRSPGRGRDLPIRAASTMA